jgi:hypothetical protein
VIKSDGFLKSATGETKKMTLTGNRDILNFEIASDTVIACFCDHKDGLFTDATRSCEVCNQACLTCQGPKASDCLTCKPKPTIKGILKIRQIPSSRSQRKGHCSVTCKDGFYVKSDPDEPTVGVSCGVCNVGCNKCLGPESRDCDPASCNDGYDWNTKRQPNLCQTPCPAGAYYDAAE